MGVPFLYGEEHFELEQLANSSLKISKDKCSVLIDIDDEEGDFPLFLTSPDGKSNGYIQSMEDENLAVGYACQKILDELDRLSEKESNRKELIARLNRLYNHHCGR